MIIINIKDGESLDKALKRFKKKFEKTGVLRELRSRQAYEKKSVARRTEIKHAVYIQNMNQNIVQVIIIRIELVKGIINRQRKHGERVIVQRDRCCKYFFECVPA